MTGESGETTMPCKGQNATCSIGPYEIQVNGSKFQAWYCEKKWGMQPEFVSHFILIQNEYVLSNIWILFPLAGLTVLIIKRLCNIN